MSGTRVSCLVALSVLAFVITANAQESSTGGLLGKLPLAFIENRDQWETPARFVARRDGMIVRFENDAMVVQRAIRGSDAETRGVVVRLAFENALESASLEGVGPEAGYHNFFLGNDPTRWRTRVPSYGSILYRGLYPGIDVHVREKSRQIEYDLVLDPGADLERVVIRCDGGQGLLIEPDGTLVIETALGPIRQEPPQTWYEFESGERRPVECRYCLVDETRFGFEVADRDPSLALIIDPGMEWSTFLGGQSEDLIFSVEVDALSGEIIAAGGSSSPDFPTTSESYDPTPNGAGDAFIVRMAADGSSLVWSTVLGTAGFEWAHGLSVDASGVVTVAGRVGGSGFPTTVGAYDESHNGFTDAFVARLDATGSTLLYSTYVGGEGHDWAATVSVDESSGEAVVTGYVQSSDFPTTPGALDPTLGGAQDAFVTRLNASGSGLVFSTFLGGSGDEGLAITASPYEAPAMGAGVSSSGLVTVVGRTSSGDYPTTVGAYDTSFNGYVDAFVTRLAAAGSLLVFSTYLGGTNEDAAFGVVVDEAGKTTVGGFTYSQFFPTTSGAYATSHSGFNDAFVARLDSMGSTLLYSTFLGGSRWDVLEELALYGPGEVVVTGWCGTGFPVTEFAYDTSYNGGTFDCFLSHLRMAGEGEDDLVYSTFLGGAADDYGLTIATRGKEITVAGQTGSADYPVTPGVLQTSYGGGHDAFITRFTDLTVGITEDPPAATSFEPPARLRAVPNPFRAATTIEFDLQRTSPVRVAVYSATGHLVRSLVQSDLGAGNHQILWDGRDENGARVSSGIYLIRLKTRERNVTRRVVMLH